MEFNYTSMLAHLNIASAHPGGLSATKKAWEQLKKYQHHCILDADCGTGKTLEFLTEVTNSRLIGIDQDQAMIKLAKQRLKGKRVELIQGKLQKLPFESGSIDCIISESVVSFNHVEPILSEYNRVLRPGGILLLIEMTGDQTLTQEMIKEVEQFYQIKSILSLDEWIESLEKGQFDLIDYFP
ncbi:MAG TPA: class I SAM-dependent methyltransferase [Bacilli bacterium]|nr:class I SAM-dependent methyltransferase [Bacilli bacterium]